MKILQTALPCRLLNPDKLPQNTPRGRGREGMEDDPRKSSTVLNHKKSTRQPQVATIRAFDSPCDT
jgi:hypothetical protein